MLINGLTSSADTLWEKSVEKKQGADHPDLRLRWL